MSQTAEVGKNAGVSVATKSYGAVAGSVSAVTSRLPGVPKLPSLKKSKDKEDQMTYMGAYWGYKLE